MAVIILSCALKHHPTAKSFFLHWLRPLRILFFASCWSCLLTARLKQRVSLHPVVNFTGVDCVPLLAHWVIEAAHLKRLHISWNKNLSIIVRRIYIAKTYHFKCCLSIKSHCDDPGYNIIIFCLKYHIYLN